MHPWGISWLATGDGLATCEPLTTSVCISHGFPPTSEPTEGMATASHFHRHKKMAPQHHGTAAFSTCAMSPTQGYSSCEPSL